MSLVWRTFCSWLTLIMLGVLFHNALQQPRDWREIARQNPFTPRTAEATAGPSSWTTPSTTSVLAAGSRPGVTVTPRDSVALPVEPAGVQLHIKPLLTATEPQPLASDTRPLQSVEVLQDVANLPEAATSEPAAADAEPETVVAQVEPSVADAGPSIGGSQDVAESTEDVAVEVAVAVETAPSDSEAVSSIDEAVAAEQEMLPPAGSWALAERIDAMLAQEATRDWAGRVECALRQLSESDDAAERRAALVRLEESVRQAEDQAKLLTPSPLATQLRRARHALVRRQALWQAVLAQRESAVTIRPAPDAARLARRLAELEELTQASSSAGDWRDYLRLESLAHAVASEGASVSDIRPLAEAALAKLTNPLLHPEMAKQIEDSHLGRLRDELRNWIETDSPQAVLAMLERFEAQGMAEDAAALAHAVQRLQWSADAGERKLGDALADIYRLGNVRVAVSAELLNAVAGRSQTKVEQVSDTMQGVPVNGWSDTQMDLKVRLLPSNERLCVRVEAQGTIRANTTAVSGPATLHNGSETQFSAWQVIQVVPRGLVMGAIDTSAETRSWLRDFSTEYDGVPFLGAIVQNKVQHEADSRRAAGEAEAEQKVQNRARQGLESILRPQVQKLNDLWSNEALAPLRSLGMRPEFDSQYATPEEMSLRLRLAGDEQLGAHTPRPRIERECLASWQIHESALNNLVERLELSGRTFSLPELVEHLRTKLLIDKKPNAKPLPEDVSFTFADEGAVRVRIEQGRAHVTMSMVELARGDDSWTDFEAHVYYAPREVNGELKLMRDGVVELEGEGLGLRQQIPLRAIFGRVFEPDRSWPLAPASVLKKPKLSEVAVSECVMDDGWISVTLEHKDPARVARKALLGAKKRETLANPGATLLR